MAREFTTRPFNPVVSSKQAASDEISKQLGEAITKGSNNGWTFHSYENVQIAIKPGCLGGMLGGGNQVAHYGVLVFYRDVD